MSDVKDGDVASAPPPVSQQTRSSRRRKTRKGKSVEHDKSIPAAVLAGRVAAAPLSGVTRSLRALMAELSIVAAPDASYYRVNLPRVVRLSAEVEACIAPYLRRARADMPGGAIAAQFLRGIVMKLQRVGIATNQLAFNSTDLLSGDINLPAPVNLLIDCFGEKTDVHGVKIAPLVSAQLIERFCVLIALAERGGRPPGRCPEAFAALSDADEVYWSYGLLPFMSDQLNRLAVQMRVPTGVILRDMGDFDDAFASIVLKRCREEKYEPEFDIRSLSRATFEFWCPTLLPKVPLAGGAPGFLLAAINDLDSGTVDPVVHFLGGRAAQGDRKRYVTEQPYPSPGTIRVPTAIATLGYTRATMEAMFHSKTTGVEVNGTHSPVVSVIHQDGMFCGTSAIAGLSVEEYAVGIVLNHQSELCNRAGFAFNVYDEARRRKKYCTTPSRHSPSDLLTMMIADDHLARTLKK